MHLFLRLCNIFSILIFSSVGLSLFLTPKYLQADNSEQLTSDAERQLLVILQEQEALIDKKNQNLFNILDVSYEAEVEKILKKYENYTNEYPRYVLGLILYGKLLNDIDREDKAYSVFLKAEAVNPEMAVIKEALASYYSKRGKYEQAVDKYFEALELRPRNPRLNYGLAELLSKKGDYEQALLYYRKALSLKSNSADYYIGIAGFLMKYKDQLVAGEYFSEGKIDNEILASYYEATRIAPRDLAIAELYAESYFKVKSPNWKNALEVWQQLENRITESTKKQAVQLNKAKVLYYMGRYDEAHIIAGLVTAPSLWQIRKDLLYLIGKKKNVDGRMAKYLDKEDSPNNQTVPRQQTAPMVSKIKPVVKTTLKRQQVKPNSSMVKANVQYKKDQDHLIKELANANNLLIEEKALALANRNKTEKLVSRISKELKLEQAKLQLYNKEKKGKERELLVLKSEYDRLQKEQVRLKEIKSIKVNKDTGILTSSLKSQLLKKGKAFIELEKLYKALSVKLESEIKQVEALKKENSSLVEKHTTEMAAINAEHKKLETVMKANSTMVSSEKWSHLKKENTQLLSILKTQENDFINKDESFQNLLATGRSEIAKLKKELESRAEEKAPKRQMLKGPDMEAINEMIAMLSSLRISMERPYSDIDELKALQKTLLKLRDPKKEVYKNYLKKFKKSLSKLINDLEFNKTTLDLFWETLESNI